MRVGLCDSGLGGLTVLKELRKKYPKNDYVYIGDNKNIPYGNKSLDELINLGQNLIDFLEKKNVDLIIIACGTLSSNVIPFLKANTKIIDVVRPTIKYINENIKKKVTVFATDATIKSHIFRDNLEYGCTEVACPLFVPMIENDDIDVSKIVSMVPNDDIIVLGCTHFPLIEKYLNNKTINMGKIIELDENRGTSSLDIYFTDINPKLEKNVKKIIDGDVKYARITRG